MKKISHRADKWQSWDSNPGAMLQHWVSVGGVGTQWAVWKTFLDHPDLEGVLASRRPMPGMLRPSHTPA